MSVQVVGRAVNLLKEVTCQQCLAILKYAPEDTEEFRSRDYTGDVDITKYIECPDCSNKVFVK